MLECQHGTANNAGPSRDDGANGSGAVGGDDNDDDNDVGKDDDTLILSSDEEEMRQQRARKFNVGSDDDEDKIRIRQEILFKDGLTVYNNKHKLSKAFDRLGGG